MIIIRKGRFYDIYRLEVEKEVGNKMLGQLILEKFSELKEIDLEDHGNRERILVNGEPAEVSRNIKLGDTITALIDKPHRTAYVQE